MANILYIYCASWLKIILCHEQIVRLLIVIHHENIHEFASLRFLTLKLKYQNIKMRRRTYEHLFFFMRLRPKSASCNRIPQLFLQLQYFLKKAAKSLHWQLSKVILSGMHNCNFEAVN